MTQDSSLADGTTLAKTHFSFGDGARSKKYNKNKTY